MEFDKVKDVLRKQGENGGEALVYLMLGEDRRHSRRLRREYRLGHRGMLWSRNPASRLSPHFSRANLDVVDFHLHEISRTTRKEIYNDTKSHLLTWFSALYSYQAFCRRLDRIAGAVRELSEIWLRQFNCCLPLVTNEPVFAEYYVQKAGRG